jgi:threonyl-tRNA synthetase
MSDVASDKEIALGQDDFPSEDAYHHYCMLHSTAHLMAYALQQMFPEARFAIGPPTKDGTNRFYYDVELPRSLSDDDLPEIESRMKALSKANHGFVQEHWERDKALAWFREHDQVYKVELIENLKDDTVSIYRSGDFVDLCAGPHVRYSSKCKHFKLLSVAGAYWRGDSSKPMLQRIYGTVWPSKEQLDEYMFRLEEAKKRDHRRVGRQLELFMHHELAPGSTFWLPKGQTLYRTLQQKMLELLLDNGYVEVNTPQLFNRKLWETSGHWQHFRENMFTFADDEDPTQSFSLKPMNCPSHMLIFGAKRRSYRELPLRIHDQGVLHRNEVSGALSGLTRVRMFRQDDGHIFVTQDQIVDEVKAVMGLLDRVYKAFDLGYRVVFSTRPAKAMGDPVMWDKAEAELEQTLRDSGVEYVVEHGEGAFYGPKIDFKVRDSLGREHQCATIQLDIQLPLNFGLEYVTADNTTARPVVIHRAIYGSFERFIAILIEHFAGAFPLWLAPEQVRVMTISEKFKDYGREVADALLAAGLRAELDDSDEKIGAKVRKAEVERIPYMLTVGAQEQEDRTVNVREQGQGRKSREEALVSFVPWLAEQAKFQF